MRPALPSKRSIQLSERNTRKITNRLTRMANRIMYSLRSLRSNVALRDMMVVRVPLPAIKGKAMGTTVEVASLLSDLKNSIPKTISNPKIKITIEPATAKERMSTPRVYP